MVYAKCEDNPWGLVIAVIDERKISNVERKTCAECWNAKFAGTFQG